MFFIYIGLSKLKYDVLFSMVGFFDWVFFGWFFDCQVFDFGSLIFRMYVISVMISRWVNIILFFKRFKLLISMERSSIMIVFVVQVICVML